MFCNNCGKKLENNSSFCSSCGSQVGGSPAPAAVPYQQPVVYVKPSVPGKGQSTAGMVLGIIALAFAFIYITSLTTNDFKYDMLVYADERAAYALGVILIPSILALIGLPLSIAGMSKGKNGKNLSGLIMCSVTLLIQIFVFIYVVTY